MHWKVASLSASTFDKVLEMTMQGEKQQDFAKKLNIHKSNVSRYVARSKQEGKLHSCLV